MLIARFRTGVAGGGTRNTPEEALDLLVPARATQVRREHRSLIMSRKRLGMWLVCDVRFRDGEVAHHTDLDRVLMRGRYPADFSSTCRDTDAVAGEDGASGRWVDYPCGYPLND
jgi:hypothetical protein